MIKIQESTLKKINQKIYQECKSAKYGFLLPVRLFFVQTHFI
jgi:hypothetical protein